MGVSAEGEMPIMRTAYVQAVRIRVLARIAVRLLGTVTELRKRLG